MENKKLTLNKVSQKTKQQNEAANAQIIKLVNNSSHLNRDDLHYRLKMLEFSGFKTLNMLKKGLRTIEKVTKERLKNSSLNNKQKAEVLLVAEMKAFRVVDELIKSIEEND